MTAPKKKPRHIWRPFEEARKYVHSLGLQSVDEWIAWAKSSKRPSDIPADVRGVYQDSWIGWGDWLGTGRVANQNKTYRPFEEARVFVQSLGLKSGNEWRRWAISDARPDDIPVDPSGVYKNDGWAGMGDWLGTGRIANQNMIYRPFEEAREFIHCLGLRNRVDWRNWAQSIARPSNIPAYPEGVYKGTGWIGWGDWLGTGRIANQNMIYRPFEEARAFVHRLALHNRTEWDKWAKSDARPNDIPAYPEDVYKNEGWAGLGNWLGTGRIANQDKVYRPFEEARAFVHSLRLTNKDQWMEWAKSDCRPVDIPSDAVGVYENQGWIGWGDWLVPCFIRKPTIILSGHRLNTFGSRIE